jgi:hypothetical protein
MTHSGHAACKAFEGNGSADKVWNGKSGNSFALSSTSFALLLNRSPDK